MRSVLPALLLLLAGCATAPISYVAAAPEASQEDPYSCALRTFNQLQFSIVNADREAGFITGERQTSGLGTAILVGRNYYDHLTVSVFADGNGGQTMRVTAGSANESAMGFGSASRTSQAPQDSAKEAATEILETCGVGEIVEQAGRLQGQIALERGVRS